ncbi:MAG: VirB8/TrbF family protein [Rickettsiales bacterium]|nr:VirB8/TrbF family protein [Rickettsiales bacterium]
MSEDFAKSYFRELSEKIESGEYFIEAREWYLSTYLSRFFERTYLVIIMLMVFALIVLVIVYYSSITPIKKSVPIKVEIEDASVLSTRISYMGDRKKEFSIDNILLKYLSARFVEALESYDFRQDFKKLDKNKKIISKLGNADINSYYENITSIRSANSLVLKYKKDVIREIFIDPNKIEIAPKGALSDSEIKQYEITINFSARESNRFTGVFVSLWQAKIGVNFENIKYIKDKKDFNDLNFKVTSYKSYEVAPPKKQENNDINKAQSKN